MRFGQKILRQAMMIGIAGSLLLPVSYIRAYGKETAPASSEEYHVATAASPVSMDVTCGFEGNAKSGRFTPVHILLNNTSETDFTGTVRIQTMEADFSIYEYEYPVSLKTSETLEQTVDIPVGRADILYVKLMDSRETELVQKRIKLTTSVDVAELFIGVLSDQPEELTYLNGVGVSYSSVRTKTFNMTTGDIPDHAVGLEQLDILLITDYNTRKLSRGQVEAIEEWVRSGGTLLLGTGARADDTLAAFPEELLEDGYEPPEERSVNMGVEYAKNGPGESFINLVCADVSLHGGKEVLSNDAFPVLTSASRGKGVIGVAAYDFVDIAEFCQNQRSYVDKLFTALLGEDKLNNLSSYLYYGNSSQYWSVQNILNTGNVDKLPNLPLYVVVVLGYIILVGPGLYLLLKKQERRRFYRSGVVVVSIVFVGVIYLMGVGTRFKNTFFTYATVLDTSDSSVNEYTYVNMRTPYNKPYAVSLDPTYDILPITRSAYYDMTPVPKFSGDESYKARITRNVDETKVSVQNTVAFSPKYFSLKKKSENAEHVGLTGNISLFNGKISGKVTNQYPFPVEKVGILMYGQMVVIEELQPGETKSLDGMEIIKYPLNYTDLMAERVTGGYLYKQTDIEDKDYMLALSRTNILRFYLDNYTTSYNAQARIVAFSRDQTDSQFLAKGSYESFGMKMLTSTIDIDIKENGYTYRSGLTNPPTIIGGQYYIGTNSTYGIDPVTLEYSLGNDIEVDTLTFESISEDFQNSGRYNYITLFKGTVYFYNHETGNYDVMDSGKTTYSARELEPYLSPGNTLTAKYICDSLTDTNLYVSLPMLTVLGRDK